MLNAKASRSRLITGAVAVMLAGALGLAPAAAAGTVSVTSACDRDLVVYGSAGDTIQITLGAGCPNSSDLNTFEASDIGPGLSFLRLAALDGEEAGHDGEPGDVNWGVLRGIRQTTVTVLLLPENANGDPLQAGSLLAVIDEASPRYDITYGGPPPASLTGTKDLTIWYRAYARASADEACRDGWRPSWAQWPHGGTGGWVCANDIYAYYPNEPVK